MISTYALWIEIDRVKNAMRQYSAKLDEMKEEFDAGGGGCCPSCAYGSRYNSVCEQMERTGAWLRVLLRKRGTADDLDFAEGVRMGTWP